MSQIVSQTELALNSSYLQLRDGEYTLSYTDATHLDPGTWKSLAAINITRSPVAPEDSEPSYSIIPRIDDSITGRERDVVLDVISLTCMRLGLVAPSLGSDLVNQIEGLTGVGGVVLIPDTNSLYNGTIHWLLHVLGHTSVWLLPFVVSLTQIQQKEAGLKSMLNPGNRKPKNLVRALRARALVNSGLGLLERNQHRYQVIELDPSLLRYHRPSGAGSMDPDEADVLEDRLLIEGVHAILSSTRTRARQVVVTSDVLLARVLGAEGIETLCLPSPRLSDQPIASVRYDALARRFVGSPLRALLWDLTHAFSTIALSQKRTRVFSTACYWPGKLPGDWLKEKLLVETPEPATVPRVTSGKKRPATRKVADPRETPMSVAAPLVPRRTSPKIEDGTISLSDAILPQASLLQTLTLAGVLREAGPLMLPELLARLPRSKRPTESTARPALEILRRAELISINRQLLVPEAELDALDRSLREDRLDEVSDQLQRFPPYGVALRLLQTNSLIRRSEAQLLLERELGGAVPREASIRLFRYHVLLGQASTELEGWSDGSFRPNDKEFVDGFAEAFEITARDGLARVIDLVPVLTTNLRMSPWAVQGRITRLAADQLAHYSFQPAVGGKPRTSDHVLGGALSGLEEIPVPIDRVFVGGRPVLTIGVLP
jgi:hypothetical protein